MLNKNADNPMHLLFHTSFAPAPVCQIPSFISVILCSFSSIPAVGLSLYWSFKLNREAMFYWTNLSGWLHAQSTQGIQCHSSKNELHSNDKCQLSRCDIATILTMGTRT